MNEAAAMKRYATKRHAEHTVEHRDEFCRHCMTQMLHEWARKQGMIVNCSCCNAVAGDK